MLLGLAHRVIRRQVLLADAAEATGCPSGMISGIIPMTIGIAKTNGRFITRLTSLPQNPASTSSRVLVFCSRSASQFR